MSMTAKAPKTPEARQMRAKQFNNTWLLFGIFGIVVVSFVRVVTGADDLAATNTIKAAVIATCPILLAGLGGLWSERAGVVNIGLEGQMILGTWGAAYFTYYYGPWMGVVGGALMGALGGLLHALATVTFGVDHIVSGVAINIMAAGAANFLAETYFADLSGGGFKQLTGLDRPGEITIPGISDAATSLADQHWFLISDLSSFVAAATKEVSTLTILVVVLVVATAWILWRTSFGLRLRSCGENPAAAESLGVNVYAYKYVAVVVSGALAGIGGTFLTIVSSSGFTAGQTNGRGYIGLAAMIFGNWRPGGTVVGALMFGYTDSLPLRSASAVHALLLVVAIALIAFALLRVYQGKQLAGAVIGGFGLAFGAWWLLTDSINRDLVGLTPYVATLLVLALASQRLRMPAADGLRYRRGQSI
ncbi:MAG TPA: ABC transporter permease [Nocardioidaceae bacterium]|nr:ABC transporter permease [Nocardioidaceae bacterium]